MNKSATITLALLFLVLGSTYAELPKDTDVNMNDLRPIETPAVFEENLNEEDISTGPLKVSFLIKTPEVSFLISCPKESSEHANCDLSNVVPVDTSASNVGEVKFIARNTVARVAGVATCQTVNENLACSLSDAHTYTFLARTTKTFGCQKSEAGCDTWVEAVMDCYQDVANSPSICDFSGVKAGDKISSSVDAPTVFTEVDKQNFPQAMKLRVSCYKADEQTIKCSMQSLEKEEAIPTFYDDSINPEKVQAGVSTEQEESIPTFYDDSINPEKQGSGVATDEEESVPTFYDDSINPANQESSESPKEQSDASSSQEESIPTFYDDSINPANQAAPESAEEQSTSQEESVPTFVDDSINPAANNAESPEQNTESPAENESIPTFYDDSIDPAKHQEPVVEKEATAEPVYAQTEESVPTFCDDSIKSENQENAVVENEATADPVSAESDESVPTFYDDSINPQNRENAVVEREGTAQPVFTDSEESAPTFIDDAILARKNAKAKVSEESIPTFYDDSINPDRAISDLADSVSTSQEDFPTADFVDDRIVAAQGKKSSIVEKKTNEQRSGIATTSKTVEKKETPLKAATPGSCHTVFNTILNTVCKSDADTKACNTRATADYQKCTAMCSKIPSAFALRATLHNETLYAAMDPEYSTPETRAALQRRIDINLADLNVAGGELIAKTCHNEESIKSEFFQDFVNPPAVPEEQPSFLQRVSRALGSLMVPSS